MRIGFGGWAIPGRRIILLPIGSHAAVISIKSINTVINGANEDQIFGAFRRNAYATHYKWLGIDLVIYRTGVQNPKSVGIHIRSVECCFLLIPTGATEVIMLHKHIRLSLDPVNGAN